MEHHRGKIGFFAEFLFRKFDKFGWDSMDREMRIAHRMEYMDKLQDYTMDEIKAASDRCEMRSTKRAPLASEILREIDIQRARIREMERHRLPQPMPPREDVVGKEEAARILAEHGFTLKRFRNAERNRMATTWDGIDANPTGKPELAREEFMTPDEIAAEDARRAV